MADWRLLVCDVNGNPLSNLSRVAAKRAFSYRLRRPARFEFEVTADDPGVWNAADGVILKPGRVIKGLRREGATYVPRYTGYVYSAEDDGTSDVAKTKVVCYDGGLRLVRRLNRDSSNNVTADGKVKFTTQRPDVIAEALLQRTNAGAGVSGVRFDTAAGLTGLATTTVEWEYGFVAPSFEELCNASGMTWHVVPEDRTDGYLGKLKLQDAIATKAAIPLGWGAPPHNVGTIRRHEDLEPLANDLRVFGAAEEPRAVAARTDATSITTYGRVEDIDVYSDLTIQAFVDKLADVAIALRKNPRLLVEWTPQADPRNPDVELTPWEDFDLGYLVDVAAGTRLRGGLTGTQRIWGFDLELNDDAVERVSRIYTGNDG